MGKSNTTAEKSKERVASSPLSDNNNNNNNNNAEDDRAACCLCHCGLDYSGREAFFEEDRRKELEEYEAQALDSDDSSDDTPYYQATDPYVPEHLYDPANALVYCDGCNRMYHQKCHFVPLMVVPRGTWHCLVCSTQKELTTTRTSAHNKNKHKNKGTTKEAIFTKAELKRVFQAPPPPAKLQHYLSVAAENNINKTNGREAQQKITVPSKTPSSSSPISLSYHTAAEIKWEVATRRAKAMLWYKTLTQSVPSSIQSQMSNWRQAQTALETLTRTKQNRQHFLEQQSQINRRGSQELAQTLVKMAGAKYKMRQMIQNLEHIRINPEFHHQQIRLWCNSEKRKNKNNTDIAAAAATDTATGPTMATSSSNSSESSKDFIDRIVFPFGLFPARSIPRTAEIDDIVDDDDDDIIVSHQPDNKDNAQSRATKRRKKVGGDDDIPREIITNGTSKKNVKTNKKEDFRANGLKKNTNNEKTNGKKKSGKVTMMIGDKSKDISGANNDSDSSSGVSLDDAKCCICLIGDATDENDLLLCDGLGCCRAYHMECLEPIVSLEELEGKDNEDWFCPLCSSLANCMHTIQSYYMGEEWDHRREDRAIAKAKKEAANKKLLLLTRLVFP